VNLSQNGRQKGRNGPLTLATARAGLGERWCGCSLAAAADRACSAGAGGEPNGCLNDAPCSPFTRHGASIKKPFGAGETDEERRLRRRVLAALDPCRPGAGVSHAAVPPPSVIG
jgi:hypothetical protein